MADISFFFRLAWKYIWKQKLILVFGFLYFLSIYVSSYPKQPNVQMACFYMIIGLILSILGVLGATGITYISYKTANGEVATFKETYLEARKLFWRVVTVDFLTFLVLSPCACSLYAFSYLAYDQSSQITPVFNILLFGSMSFSILIAFSSFIVIGFIAYDWGIRKSVKNAWRIFTDHFGVLASAGIILVVTPLLINAILFSIAMVIESSLGLYPIGTLHYPDIILTLRDRPLANLFTSLTSIIWMPYTELVFVIAYLKYSGVKENDLIKVLSAPLE